MIAEITILNGTPADSEVKVDGITKDHTLTAQELADIAAGINALQAIDTTNCGWYIEVNESVDRIEFFLKDASIDANNTVCDKGGIISEDGTPTAYAKLEAATTSILAAVLP